MNILLKNKGTESLEKKDTISYRLFLYIIYGTYLLSLFIPGLFYIGIALS
jgi:hypothetical protein